MTDLLWHPKNHQIGDITIIRVGDEYHLFTEQTPMHWDGDVGAGFAGLRTVGHAISKDLFTWEELPITIGCGPPGSFDAFAIYHMDVFIHEGTWYMHYTGLDKDGEGQQQAIGLATSRDGIHWQKQPANPILRADERWYEQRIEREATYQEKDFGRLWFRDPCIIRDPETGKFGMIVIARDRAKPLDVRACLAWATSDDLVAWKAHAPIYSPGRFHTIESPSIFERNGLHYIVYMTGSYWGPPLVVTDPYQNTGNFYAISRNGWTGPFEPPADEVLVAADDQLRMGAARTVDGPDGERYYYGWLIMKSSGDDAPYGGSHPMVVPPARRVRFLDDGQMQVVWNQELLKFTTEAQLPPLFPTADFNMDGSGVLGKNFWGSSAALYAHNCADAIVSARIEFIRGERAGLVLRTDPAAVTGVRIVADRRMRRVEFGILGSGGFIDARAWQPKDEFTLKVVAYRQSIQVYLDDRLYIHQVRHRETAGQFGLFIDKAEARFREVQLHVFKGK